MSLSDADGTHRPEDDVPRRRVPSPPMFQFTVQGGVNHDGSARPDIEVAVVSLARYTFADPVTAMNGPALLEPPAERSRILPPTLGSGEEATAGAITGYDDDGLIADFTEDRCNRQLAHIARRLLLPDSYVEACYDLHQFLATRAVLETESVQRNVFKCLKICARLSKLPGYSIQLMWQVIQQAHQLIDMFSAERARTINLWLTKLTNRIRLMAVTPASDGSAPPRLPIVPPPELLHTQTREKLLPLPSMSVAALNDGAFNRAVGVSGAAHYLANPLTSTTRLLTAGSNTPRPPPLSSPLQVISEVSETNYTSTESDSGEIEVRSVPLLEEESNLISAREAELAIIELQLRELENVPAHRMGPMVRAALNLLVEMRFRLQLGLPRQAIAAEDPGMISGSEQPATPSRTLGLLADGAGGLIGGSNGRGENDEIRIIDYVLDQISTSRRQQAQIRAAEGGSSGSSFGIPLFMMPQSHSGTYYSTDTSEYDDEGGRHQMARLPAPDLRPSGIRRRRRRRSESALESVSLSDAESASEDENETTEESESVTDNNTSAGDDSDQERRRRNHLRRRLFQI
ncbi:hypothetical protein GGI19_002318 [Coemansia pectinata]|uniref:Uncharacterized protein n=1 Tax=Coemansia pectinata TaxID=1052879 RepID=A0A9W8LBD5_9FUNG|nr:hypothetical protein GGI19_002318 [Coemansia pectinata]